MMRLLLIRHGQTPANVLGQLDTHAPGPGLTDIGFQQAAAIPRALRDQPVDAIYASTLVRTQLTAQPLASELGLATTVLDGLREIEAGTLEDRTDPASVDTYLTTSFLWAEGHLDERIPGGPDGNEFFDRYDDAIAHIQANGDEVVAVFSHGTAIRTWAAARVANIDGSYASTHQLDNTGMVTLQRENEDDPWELVTWLETPLGGSKLADARAVDPAGDTLLGARARQV
ncbi:histidine phosphatase family protein [Subtercola frigoramans]|uniref:Phosphoglycerate mutase n=1 Tax=Subtercola frigoramans TaxID=120298 RepID=A0ABS2L0C8_9MICO|nr:histidine phosphatase family protein [Subtercola frigoramans]MBM7470535.1 putative phosphoglycerate mutase [Subtercola frigoramans]